MTAKYTRANGYEADCEVIYGDTDSVMVHFRVRCPSATLAASSSWTILHLIPACMFTSLVSRCAVLAACVVAPQVVRGASGSPGHAKSGWSSAMHMAFREHATELP